MPFWNAVTNSVTIVIVIAMSMVSSVATVIVWRWQCLRYRLYSFARLNDNAVAVVNVLRGGTTTPLPWFEFCEVER